MLRRLSQVTPAICLLFSTSLFAADDWSHQWPAWRGPSFSGVAPHADPPLTWSETENVAWKVAVPGKGHGSPIVWGDRIYLTTAIETERAGQAAAPDETAKTVPPERVHQFVVLCLDRATGETLWSRVAREEVPREGMHQTNSYASSSPMTDGERLYVSFGSRGIYCFTLEGEPIWDRDLGEMRTRFGWGEGASPAVAEGVVVVTWDHEDDSFIVGLDAATGEERWRQPREEVTSWATPLIVPGEERTQVIVNGTKRVRSYELSSGKLLWECGGQTINVIPSPVHDDRAAYVMSGYRGAALFALPLDATGDITGSDRVLWQLDRGTPYVPSPVLVEGKLYFTAGNNGILTCVNVATGEELFGPVRLPEVESVYASPVSADGRIYFCSRDGVTAVVAAKNEFEVIAVNRIDEPIDATPAVVGNAIYLRSAGHLYCLRQKQVD
ncbi:MAG: PQQ-binding-like beta-propeller repeat protein [Planctomycetaceae bacterium]